MAEPALLASLGENPLLPMPSAIALRICAQVKQPDCSLKEVTASLRQDPALGGKILQTVNSALFSLPRPLVSLERTFHLLGLRAIRSLVLSLSLPSLTGRSMNETARQEYWTSAVAGGIVARELAVMMRRSDPEDDMVAGLLRDVGKLILQQILPQTYGRVLSHSPEVLAANQSWVEEQLLGTTHADVSALILQRWGLPGDITEAVRCHHQPEQTEERAQRLHFASLVARLALPACPPVLARTIVKMARDRFGMNEQELGDFLETVTPKINALASLLQVEILPTDNFSLLLAGSLEQLVDNTRAANGEPAVENLDQTSEQEVAQLRRTIMRLRRQTLRDPLTDTFSREFMDETLALELKRASRKAAALGLVLIHLDGLKPGTHQPLADQVLKEVAARLRRRLRAGEIVGRHGENSFGVIVDNTSVAGVQSLAGRLWQTLSPVSFQGDNHVETFALSVSAVVCNPATTPQTPASLLAALESARATAKTNRPVGPTLISLLTDKDNTPPEQVAEPLHHRDNRLPVGDFEAYPVPLPPW